MRNRIFFKLMAAFLVVILAAAVTFDVMIGGAWEASLRTEIQRNLIQKTQLLARRVETDRTHQYPAAIIKELGALGLMGIFVPESYGGAGLDHVSYAVAIEELAVECAATAVMADNPSVQRRPHEMAAQMRS